MNALDFMEPMTISMLVSYWYWAHKSLHTCVSNGIGIGNMYTCLLQFLLRNEELSVNLVGQQRFVNIIK